MGILKKGILFILILLSACALYADPDVYSLPVYFVKNVTGNVGFSSKAVMDYLPPDSIIQEISFKYYRIGNTVEFRTDAIYLFCQIYTTSKIKMTISSSGGDVDDIPWTTTLKNTDGLFFGYGGTGTTSIVVYDETSLPSTAKPRVWSKDFSISVSPGDVDINSMSESSYNIGYITISVEDMGV